MLTTRGFPSHNYSCLYRNGPDRVVWQTNTSTPANDASLTITFEGNLVLFTNTTLTNGSTLTLHILWQSYDHPTDTLMVLQALRPGYNLTASGHSDSNKTANYTLVIGPGGNCFPPCEDRV